MKCEHCPTFVCKLNSDFKRHILTKSHQANVQIIKEKENKKDNELILNQHYYVMWAWKMRYILVDLRDLKGIGY
jgi:hypothetical protein